MPSAGQPSLPSTLAGLSLAAQPAGLRVARRWRAPIQATDVPLQKGSVGPFSDGHIAATGRLSEAILSCCGEGFVSVSFGTTARLVGRASLENWGWAGEPEPLPRLPTRPHRGGGAAVGRILTGRHPEPPPVGAARRSSLRLCDFWC
jgi:hypothetical protein